MTEKYYYYNLGAILALNQKGRGSQQQESS